MASKLPRWLIITLIALALLVLIGGNILLYHLKFPYGLIFGGLLTMAMLAVVIGLATLYGPMLWRYYKFSKYYKENEDTLRQLPHLMQQHRSMAAQSQFEGIMKNAPEGAYIYFMKAFFYQSSEQFPEALYAAKRALALAGNDQMLPILLQQAGGEMGQPKTVAEFKEQMERLVDSLQPRVTQMRQRREKSIEKRKKKSRQ